jgi:hypothetical protein
VIFVDTNVIMYAVGRAHPLREPARAFLARHVAGTGVRLCTSAEVQQELMHAYLPVSRMATLDAALELVEASIDVIWPLEPDDVLLARRLAGRRPSLTARDLIHLACCQRRGVKRIQTFDRALAAAFETA